MFGKLLTPITKMGERRGARFIFLEASYDHPCRGKTWLSVPLELHDIGVVGMDRDIIEPTMCQIDAFVTEHDVNVLLGFSQGANMIDTWLACRPDQTAVKRVVLLSGYQFVGTEDMPRSCDSCLNVISDVDEIVPPGLLPRNGYSTLLLEKHNKGHKVPTTGDMRRKIVDFITARHNIDAESSTTLASSTMNALNTVSARIKT